MGRQTRIRFGITALLWIIASPVFAGQVYNPFTGRLDFCATITEEDGSPTSSGCNTLEVTNGTLTDDGDGTFSISTGGSSGNSFETIDVPAGTDPVADASTDTLTITETTFLTFTGTAGTDTIDITQVTTDIGTDGLIAADAVALGTDTTNAYVSDLTAGTAIDVSGGGAETANVTVNFDSTEVGNTTWGSGSGFTWTFDAGATDPTLSLASDLVTLNSNLSLASTFTLTAGSAVTFVLPQSSAPTTAAAGRLGFDNNAWATGRGAGQVNDGTANTYLVGTLTTDTPSNGQVPKWNTGGTITWEADADSGGATAWSAIGDAAGTGSIDFAGFDQDIISAEDGGDILTITTTDADQGSDTTILRLATNDTSDANTRFLIGAVDEGGTPVNDWIVAAGGTAGGLVQDWGSTGVKVTTDGDGAVTFLGTSAGADEDLNINLDDTTDKIVLSSSTSANEVQFSSLDILVGGGNINTGNIALTVGDATTDAITLTTDSTGDAEIVAPNESIGAAEIVNPSTNKMFSPKSAKLSGAYVLETFASLDTAAESATISGGSGPWKLLFDAATDEAAVWDWVLPDDWAAHGTLVVIYALASATTLEVEWEAALQCTTPGDAEDIDGAAFADGATAGGNTVPGTAGHTDSSAITLTDDSCAAGDLIYFYVSTDADDATNDDATGDRELLAVEYNYTTTQ